MTKIHDLSKKFERESEILEVTDSEIICAVDGRGEKGNCCTIFGIDQQSGATRKLLVLPDTRIYESFNTYRMADAWFYAVSVDEHYKVRLQMIDKKNFSIIKIADVLPEREVLQIFPVSEDFIIVVEEMPSVYLWQLSTGKKYNLKKVFGGSVILDGHLWHAGSKNAFLTLQCADDETERVLTMNAASFIRSVTKLLKPEVTVLAGPAAVCENGGVYDDGFYLHVMEKRRGEKETMLYFDCSGLKPERKSCTEIRLPSEGTVVRSSLGGHVWQVIEDRKAKIVSVKNLSGTASDFTYPLEDGDFNGYCLDDLALTIRYDTVIVRDEHLFSEVLVLHDLENGTRKQFKGGYEVFPGNIVLKKSFLYL